MYYDILDIKNSARDSNHHLNLKKNWKFTSWAFVHI